MEIPAGNDTSRDLEYGLGRMVPESINIALISGLGIPNGYRDVSVPAGISIVNISFKCFPGGFLEGPVVSEIAVPDHAKNPLG
jgi:hypothetical protein